MFTSFKFNFLNHRIKKFENFEIPQHIKIPLYDQDSLQSIASKFILKNKPCILRSSTEAEASSFKIGSGQSVSVKNIFTIQDFNAALSKVNNQSKKIVEILLQKQIKYEAHYTASYSEGCFFVEKSNLSKLDVDFNHKTFCFFTKKTFVGKLDNKKILIACLLELNSWLKYKNSIFELGVRGGQVYIFQGIEVDKHFLESYYKNAAPLIKQTLSSSQSYSPLRLIKLSFQSMYYIASYRFSAKKNMKAVLNNWSCILFYFYLFATMKNKKEDPESFIHFLSYVQEKEEFLAKLAYKHIVIANKISSQEFFESGFLESLLEQDNNFLYLGVGEFKGQLNKNIFFYRYLDPKILEKYKKNKEPICILTSDFNLLSHGFLMAAEYNIFIVANIGSDYLKSVEHKKRVVINFNKKQISFS